LHVLILLAFRGPKPKGLCARHLNGDTSDNRLENLAYGTYQENSLDATLSGRGNQGERHGNAKLTDKIVLAIRRRAALGAKLAEIAREFHIHKSTACQIIKGHSWRHIGGLIP